jgi:hypothetical protein
MDSFLVDVSRRYNASSAGLKKLVGLDLRWDRRLTQFPYPMEKAISYQFRNASLRNDTS